ncbi:hypothetical protein [Corynebacterium sp. A21]|uniref:hypothetical protein n=1 Tax=Corynebacterium sp. A21 TaxID=3457318 RepID=UPI003FD3BA81
MTTSSTNQPARTPDNLRNFYRWLDDEHLLVLSNDPFEGEGLQPLGALMEEIQQGPGSGIIAAIGGVAVIGQVVGTLHNTFKTTGYLKFTDATAKLLEEGRTLTEKNGEIYGSLRGPNGRYAERMAVTRVTVNPESNPITEISDAVGQFALNMQIRDFSKINAQLSEDVNSLLEEQRQIKHDEISAIADTINGLWREADRLRAVDNDIFYPVRHSLPQIAQAIKTYRTNVQKHLKHMKDAPVAYFKTDGQQIIFDVHGMLLAEETWLRWNYLRIANVRYTTGDDARTTELLADLAEARTTSLSEISSLMDDIDHYSWIFTSVSKQSTGSIPSSIYQLTKWAASMGGVPHQEPAFPFPKYLAANSWTVPSSINIANAILPRDDTMLAVGEVATRKRGPLDTTLVLTSTTLYLEATATLQSDGRFDIAIPIKDLTISTSRYSMVSPPTLTLTTGQRTFNLTFGKSVITEQRDAYDGIVSILKGTEPLIAKNKKPQDSMEK